MWRRARAGRGDGGARGRKKWEIHPQSCSTRLASVLIPQISDAFVVLWFPGDHSLRLAWVLAPFLKGQSNRNSDGVWDCGGVWPVSCGAQACPHLSPQAPARDPYLTWLCRCLHTHLQSQISLPQAQAPPHIRACCHNGVWGTGGKMNIKTW